MTRVTIVSLIYRSPALADWVYQSALKFTPMIARGEAEFLFVANDPTPSLLQHLRDRGYPHVVNLNRLYSDADLLALGYGTPEYMSRVYRGYNEGIRQARGDYVVLVNSDNYFSPDWLENLLKYSDRTNVVTSALVEREHPTFGVFPGAIHGEFGGSIESFDEPAFLAFAARIRKTGLEPGGAYMPLLLPRDLALEAGLYPCGNVAGSGFEDVVRYGDEAFFDVLQAIGIGHNTALDSVVYHLKEGERDDPDAGGGPGAHEQMTAPAGEGTPATAYPAVSAIRNVDGGLPPTKRHADLMAGVTSGRLAKSRSSEAQIISGLDAQGRRLRAAVTRVVGARRADSVIAFAHHFAWIVRPLRRMVVRRRRP